ncbi:MAG: PEP-CTERM sorting domain-containing protein [Verrucomicrobiota bacterium]
MIRKNALWISFGLAALVGVSEANINWAWSWIGIAGTEAGFFETDGDLSGGNAPAGTYTFVDFLVTESANGSPLGSVSGGQYSIGQPSAGFVWDGSSATQWFRSSGSRTNGANLSIEVDTTFFYAFSVGLYELRDALFQDPIDSGLTLTLAPVPEPSSYVAIFGVIALGFVALRRR